VFGTWLCTGPLLEYMFGVKPLMADRAGYYASVLALSIPAQVNSRRVCTEVHVHATAKTSKQSIKSP